MSWKRGKKKFADGLHLSGTKYPIDETAGPSIDPERTTIRKNINGKETILSSVSKQALRQPNINHKLLPSNSNQLGAQGKSNSLP